MLGISKRGDTYLRTLSIHGARTALTRMKAPPPRVKPRVVEDGAQPASPRRAGVQLARRPCRLLAGCTDRSASPVTVTPIVSGGPTVAAAAVTAAGVVHDAAVTPTVSGLPQLAASAVLVPASALSGLLAHGGDRILAGATAAAQHLADALRIQRGPYPRLRDYGSKPGARRRPPPGDFAAVAETVTIPPTISTTSSRARCA